MRRCQHWCWVRRRRESKGGGVTVMEDNSWGQRSWRQTSLRYANYPGGYAQPAAHIQRWASQLHCTNDTRVHQDTQQHHSHCCLNCDGVTLSSTYGAAAISWSKEEKLKKKTKNKHFLLQCLWFWTKCHFQLWKPVMCFFFFSRINSQLIKRNDSINYA